MTTLTRSMARVMAALVALALATPSIAGDPPLSDEFSGTWALDTKSSDEVPAWRQMQLEITVSGETVTIVRNLGWGRRQHADTINLPRGGGTNVTQFDWWADNRHLAAYVAGDHQRTVKVDILDAGRTLRTESHFEVETQQSSAHMRITSEYRLWPYASRLTLIETRSSRATPVVHHFTRAERAASTP